MPRPSKGPRLALERGDDRAPTWVIRDGQRKRSTGCHEPDCVGAEKALAAYITSKHDPARAVQVDDVNTIKIADVCSLELKYIAKRRISDDYKRRLMVPIVRIGNWMGERVIGDLTSALQEQYAAERGFPVAARLDLKFLSAAINRCVRKTKGGIHAKFSPTLPDAPDARVRWLTRDEAARLIWAAWRPATNKGASRHRLRHIARYILVGVYTGSRNGDICGAAVIPTIGRGYVDLDRGIFKRKPDNKEATSKRQPTIPLPTRLLAHMRRWQRLGVSTRSVIEFNSESVSRISRGWETIVDQAGLATEEKKEKVLRHTLRHTAITWYLAPDRRTGRVVDIEVVSQYCGVSVETIRKTYRHETPQTFDALLNISRHQA